MMKARQAQEILETLAFHEAAGCSQAGTRHASRLARVPVKGWQADVIRRADSVRVAATPEELRAAMADSAVVTVFLPEAAMVTGEIIERACIDSSSSKMIVWETDG